MNHHHTSAGLHLSPNSPMSSNRSDTVYGYYRESSDKFDYFITGISGALVAFVGQNISPVRIGWNSGTVELLGLTVLLGSLLLGFRRIETNVTVFQLMHQRLHREEGRGNLLAAYQGGTMLNSSTGDVLSPIEIEALALNLKAEKEVIAEKLEELSSQSGRFYRWRNRLLLAGFILLITARILPAYL
jgi:hypothetical protein